jgi:hypothetical protein
VPSLGIQRIPNFFGLKPPSIKLQSILRVQIFEICDFHSKVTGI